MKFKQVAIKACRPDPANPRKIPEDAVERLAAVIRDYGFRVPVLLDRDMCVIAGHTRLLAAERLGMAEVPVIIADDLTPEQAAAFRIIENASHEWTSWDEPALRRYLLDLGDVGAQISQEYLMLPSQPEIDRMLTDFIRSPQQPAPVPAATRQQGRSEAAPDDSEDAMGDASTLARSISEIVLSGPLDESDVAELRARYYGRGIAVRAAYVS